MSREKTYAYFFHLCDSGFQQKDSRAVPGTYDEAGSADHKEQRGRRGGCTGRPRKQSLLETFSEDDERNYIYTVTRNEALRYARAQKKNPEYVTISASDPYIDIEGEPDIDAFRNEFGFSDNVAAALRELNESERDLICYYYGAGFSYRQLGRLMDVKPATLRKRMERCLKKLETVLREEQIR